MLGIDPNISQKQTSNVQQKTTKNTQELSSKEDGDRLISSYYGKPAQQRPVPPAITSAKYHDQAAWNDFNKQKTNMPQITFIARATEKPDEELDMHPNINTGNIARTTDSPSDELENLPNLNNNIFARTTEEIELDNKIV